LPIKDPFKVKADGGQIDAVSGATVSSRGVCAAMAELGKIYERLRKEIMQKIQA
jgi:electron transport complex protein RnfG